MQLCTVGELSRLQRYRARVENSAVPLIDAQGITKRYGALAALDDVSARVDARAVGLLGANGAGKSTLMKTMLGLITPDSGTVKVLGVDVAGQDWAARRRLGYMPEHSCLPLGMTARDLVVHMGELRGLPRARRCPPRVGGALPGGARGGALPPDQDVLGGHAAAHQPGPGDRPLARAGGARRAHQRPRPRRPRGDAHAGAAALDRSRHRRRDVLARAGGRLAHV